MRATGTWGRVTNILACLDSSLGTMCLGPGKIDDLRALQIGTACTPVRRRNDRPPLIRAALATTASKIAGKSFKFTTVWFPLGTRRLARDSRSPTRARPAARAQVEVHAERVQL